VEHQVEATGATVEEAIESALGKLGASRDEVSVDILDPGGSRFLGLFGGRQAHVRVALLSHRHASLKELAEDLLRMMDIACDISVRQVDDVHEVQITTDGLDGLLIGRRGQTLSALQHILSRMASREFGRETHLVVDVGDYRKRREDHLVEKARVLSEKVRVTGREIHLEPLHAPDRRIVHLAVEEIEGVRSYTVGQGLHRTVVIAPESKGQ
jgi:spoIIIJ-associated protein